MQQIKSEKSGRWFNMAEQKNQNRFIDAVRIIWVFFKLDVDDLKALLPISVSYGLLTLTVPLGVQVLINRILSTALPSQATAIVLLVSLGLIAAAFLRITQRAIVEKIQRRFHSRIVLAASSLSSSNSQNQISHLYYDTFTVQKSLSSLLMDGIGVGIQLLFALTLLAFYHPFFLAFDLIIILGLLAVVGLPMQNLLKTAIDESKSKHETAKFLSNISNFKDQQSRLEAADETAVSYLKARLGHFKFVIQQMIGLSGLHITANALLLGFGSSFVIPEAMSLAQLVAAELVFSSAFISVEKLNKHLETFYDLIAALDKLSSIVTHAPEVKHEQK